MILNQQDKYYKILYKGVNHEMLPEMGFRRIRVEAWGIVKRPGKRGWGFAEDGKCGYVGTKTKGERFLKNPEDTSAKTLEMSND